MKEQRRPVSSHGAANTKFNVYYKGKNSQCWTFLPQISQFHKLWFYFHYHKKNQKSGILHHLPVGTKEKSCLFASLLISSKAPLGQYFKKYWSWWGVTRVGVSGQELQGQKTVLDDSEILSLMTRPGIHRRKDRRRWAESKTSWYTSLCPKLDPPSCDPSQCHPCFLTSLHSHPHLFFKPSIWDFAPLLPKSLESDHFVPIHGHPVRPVYCHLSPRQL